MKEIFTSSKTNPFHKDTLFLNFGTKIEYNGIKGNIKIAVCFEKHNPKARKQIYKCQRRKLELMWLRKYRQPKS